MYKLLLFLSILFCCSCETHEELEVYTVRFIKVKGYGKCACLVPQKEDTSLVNCFPQEKRRKDTLKYDVKIFRTK